MKRVLYDLAAADESVRFSPYCWRVKLALAHKNLPYETVPWHFTEKDVIAFSGQGKVPVLVDGARVVADSQAIAEYLEAAYPNEASLFGDPPSRALTHFIRGWADEILNPAIARIVLPDIFPRLDVKDQAYFRETRERAWGMRIEDFYTERTRYIAEFAAVLKPLRSTLAVQGFIAGPSPSYADHIVFGSLQWARLMSATALFEPGDRVEEWMEAVLEAYGL
jgi:glutathione S-transferase